MKPKQNSGSQPSPKKILEEGTQALHASSCIFYIRDPWWNGQFVPVFMPGVKHTEPMHGFVLPSSSYRRIASANNPEKETYFPDTSEADELFDRTSFPLRQLIQGNELFGNFAQREQVGSCARLRHFSPDGELEAILWINFSRPSRKFAKRKMRGLMKAMVGHLPHVVEKYVRENPFPIKQLLQILNPAEQLAAIGRPLNEQNLDWYLTQILSAVLQAFAIREDTGIGTIHLFDPVRQVLIRKIHIGAIADDAPKEQNVQLGEGVISWVALKHRALLIPDLATSSFGISGNIYREFAPNAVSELAIPMLAGDELLGVVNLESTARPCPFSPYSVRTIWYTASQAAIACRLSQEVSIAHTQTQRTNQLLQLAHDAIVKTENSRPLQGLAELARDWLQADGCDIWQCREDRHKFISSGASYQHDTSVLPRENGWSQYVRRAKTSVWLSEVVARDDFKSEFWNEVTEKWEPVVAGPPPPATVNERLIALGVRCELGIPIEVAGQCVGVAWLKYSNRFTPAPIPLNMRLAHGFAAQAGLVIDVLQRQEESAQKAQALRDYRDRIFKTGQVDEFPGLEGHVIRHACGEVGGDFHIWQPIDERRISFLIGDAEGHGILGALYMLPLIATFTSFSRQSCSTKHILWRLLPVCDRWELRATALCFIIERSARGNRPLIFASSAAHHPLIILKQDRQNFDFPDKQAEWANRGQLGLGLDRPMGEEVKELSPGDLIIAYTDGVLEPSRDMNPVERAGIVEAASTHFTETPEKIAKAIEEKVLAHAGGHLEDDATIMVLRVK